MRVLGFPQIVPIASTRSRSGSMRTGAARRVEPDRARRGGSVAGARALAVSLPETTPWDCRPRRPLAERAHRTAFGSLTHGYRQK